MSGSGKRKSSYSSSAFPTSSRAGGLGKVKRTVGISGRSGMRSDSIRRSSAKRRSSSRPRRRLLDGVNQGALRGFLTVAAFVGVGVIGLMLIFASANSSSKEIEMAVIDNAASDNVITTDDAGSTVSIALGGTIKLQDEILNAAKSEDSYNFNNYLSEVKQVMNADISIIDLLGTVSESGSAAGYPEPVYPTEVVEALRNIGVTHAVTSNNAILSNGYDGMVETNRLLSEGDITALGTSSDRSVADRVYVKRVNSINIGIGAYSCLSGDKYTAQINAEKEKGVTDSQLGYCINQLNLAETRNENDKSYSAASDAITADVKAMRESGAQFIIICIDWDSEGRLTDNMANLAQRMIDLGVDVVVGYGFDTPQRVTVKKCKLEDGTEKKCYIFYSLGNLFSDCDSGQTQSKQESMVVNITLRRDANSKVINSTQVVYHPMYTFHDKNHDTEGTYLKYRVVPAMAYKGGNANGDASTEKLISGCGKACTDMKEIIESYGSNKNGSVTKDAVGLGTLSTAQTGTEADSENVGENSSV